MLRKRKKKDEIDIERKLKQKYYSTIINYECQEK